MLRNNYETMTLKSLSLLVLERNKKRNEPQIILEKRNNCVDDFETFSYLFEERTGIYQYDANLNQIEAEKKALSDIKLYFLRQYSLNENSSEFKEFMGGFEKYLNLTVN